MPEKFQSRHSPSPKELVTSTGLAALTQAQLETWAVQAQAQTQVGQLPNYIPLLAQANPTWFAVQVQRLDGPILVSGDATQLFPLMSLVKPFVLLYLLEQLGMDAVFQQVGMEPSDQPFNSLTQLEADQGWPRNPMINSGAIALAALLPGNDGLSRCDRLRHWLNHHAGCQLVLDQAMLASVHAAGGERNRTIMSLLARFGRLELGEIGLDAYNHICCLTGTVADSAKLGILLAQSRGPIQLIHQRAVNAILVTCGLYQASGRFAVEVGLPTKSGVSGALLSVIPGQGAIACYSPALDPVGNPLAGLFLLKQLTQALNLSLFS